MGLDKDRSFMLLRTYIANAIIGALACFIVFGFFFGFSVHFASAFNSRTALDFASGIALVGLCVSALFLRADGKVNLCLILLSLTLSVYGIEVFLGLWKPRLLTPLDAIESFRSQGLEVLPRLAPSNFIKGDGINIDQLHIFPLSEVSNKTIVLCNENGYWATYRSDEHGFNNPTGMYSAKVIDLALIGDSYTLGSCVNPGQDVGARLRSLGYSVINLGMGGTGPLVQLGILNEYGQHLKPKMAVWLYYEGNDLLNLYAESTAPTLRRYLDREFTQNLIEKQTEIDLALKSRTQRYMIQSYLRLVRIRNLVNSLGDGAHGTASETYHPLQDEGLFVSVLKAGKQRVEDWGGTLHFVYLPSFVRYKNRRFLERNEADLFDRAKVLRIVQSLEIPVIDFGEVFDARENPLSLFPSEQYGHYTPEGYVLLARQIASHLRVDGFTRPDKGIPHDAVAHP